MVLPSFETNEFNGFWNKLFDFFENKLTGSSWFWNGHLKKKKKIVFRIKITHTKDFFQFIFDAEHSFYFK